jgi:hypothetical protein
MEGSRSSDREFDSGDRAELVAKFCKLSGELLIVLEPRRFLPTVEKALSAG